MRTDDIRWESFERSALPQALFGSGADGVQDWRLENALQTGNGIALGYAARSDTRCVYAPPVLIVLEDSAVAETLSWLKTFAPETSPLSQFARIVSRSDWVRFSGERSLQNDAAVREDRWACVVLGELLAQGDIDIDVNTFAFSWSASCFSTAVARTAIMHSTEEARRTCADRLVLIEKDHRFGRRLVPIAALEPVWTIAASADQEIFGMQRAVDLVFDALRRMSDRVSSLTIPVRAAFGPDSEFASDSVESRVVAFQRLVADMSGDTGDAGPTGLSSAIIAAAAFLVGRGTSHGFLLSRLAKRWPHVFPWFGLLAGLAGPQSWNSEWSRAAKGIERLLKGRFEWCGVSGADLCWIEYLWLTNTFSGKQVFAEMPKMLPKAVSVEIVPGAACQLRLAADEGGSRQASSVERANAERRDKELRSTLDEIAGLALRARNLASGLQAQRGDDQGQLFAESGKRDPGAKRSGRGKRDQS